MVQIRAIRPPKAKDLTLFLRTLFLRTERQIIDEITRKRAAGYVDYAEVAALERVQRILQTMVDESWSYVPQMIEKIFYHSDKHAAGYANARALTASQTAVVQQLSNNLLGEILEASETAYQTAQEFFTIARLEADPYRKAALTQTVAQEALGTGWKQTSAKMAAELRNQGLTGFVDKAGRKWTLSNYCNMATRTTARQAEVAAVLTADDYDLWQIVKIGSTCPVCAPLEGRVYSKSGTNPDYPPLSLAFGKVDPAGPEELTNTYLNIHPNCLVPGGSILCESLVSASRRYYTGDVIGLKTASGNEITVTPNHPILTTKGFVAAASLKEGDKIIEATAEYAAFLGKAPNNVYIPTGIEEIFHSLIQSRDSSAVRVKGSSVQFHGDGIANRKVDIVFPASFGVGERDIIGGKPLTEHGFPSTHFRWLLLFANSTSAKVIVSTFHSLYSFMRGFGFVSRIKAIAINGKKLSNLRHGASANFSDLRVSHSLIVKLKKMLKLLSVGFKKSWGNIRKTLGYFRRIKTVVNSRCADSLVGNPEIFGDFIPTEPLLIKRLQSLFSDNCLVISELTHKETSFYNGYVYNLETKPHYYVYNNIVTHNCLHSLIKYTTIGKSEKQIQRDKDFSDPKKNPLNRDPRTKKQIAAYQEKERNRQRLLRDMKQHKEYQTVLGSDVPKDFEKFREMKYNNIEKWEYIQGLKKYLDKYPTSDKRYYDVELELKKSGIKVGVPLPPVLKQAFILPEGKHDPYHVMRRMLERGITDDNMRSYMADAKCMFVQWNGKRQRFVSKKGMVVVTKNGNDWIYKTAWKKEDYGAEADKIMEVLKKYGL